MAVRRRRRNVWFAKFNRRVASLRDERFEIDIIHALDPERRVTRYGRTWRLSQPARDESGRFLYAKLGFVRRAAREEVRYDEQRHDFVTEQPPGSLGSFSFFVIDLESRVMAFEERQPDIRRQSFLGALQKLVEPFRYEIDLLSDESSFSEWATAMDKIIKVHISLVPTNPGKSHAEEVRALVDDINSARTSVEAVSELGLKVEGTFIGASAEHVAGGNGRFRATGLVGSSRRFFDSVRRLVTRTIDVTDDDSGDMIVTKLVRRLDEVVADGGTDPPKQAVASVRRPELPPGGDKNPSG